MSKETAQLVEQNKEAYRLPKAVYPLHYDLKLTPDLNNFTFTGSETIKITVEKPSTQIVLNAADLTIKQAHIDNGQGKEYAAQIAFDKENEQVVFTFPEIQTIQAGTWFLRIDFDGILNDKLHGFYRSNYKNEKGENKILASTQFEATDARRAFPCFDEPQLKATFKITLVIDQNLTGISNAGIAKENMLSNGKKEIVFKETIKMSTYYLAFMVGEFESSEVAMVGKTPIKIWSVPGKKHLSHYALQCAKDCLAFFNKYYEIPYPGDKLDLIAIPDFVVGGMENLGAITFRENALLIDEKAASHVEQERIADVIAHELSHMWFGDLVTMKWWNGLWLNEAFATFMEILAVNAWKPNWHRWDSFAVEKAAAYAVDGLKSTRPVEFPVKHPDEAAEMFDVLTYQKGGSVLRMLEQYIGAEEFRKGISLYLNKHKYANAETTDLWDALEESSRQPVRKMMDSWIFQGGFPLVTVELDEKGTGLYVSQERFFYLQDNANENQIFHVPVMLKCKTDKGMINKKFILDNKKTHVELQSNVEWAIANEGGHGFYRVRYAPNLLSKLKSVLTQSQESLSAIERFNLISDTWAATIAGLVPLKDYLMLIKMFQNETDKNVWTIIIGSLHYLNKVINTDSRKQLETFVCKLVGPTKEKLGFKKQANEDDLTGQLRGLVLTCMGALGDDPKTQTQAHEFYASYKKNPSSVDPNIISPLVSILAYTGGAKEYQEFHKEFQEAKTPQQEQRYLFALASFKQPELLKETLERSISGEVRTQNAPYLIQVVLSNPYGREIAWDFIKKNWQKFYEIFPESTIPRMCDGVTSLVTAKLEKDVQQFFATHPVRQGEKAITQHLERLHIAVLFKEREDSTLATINSST